MQYNQYKFKFYLNASHAIYIKGILGEKHPHTWEIEISTVKQKGIFVKFEEVEDLIEPFLEQYQNKFLNEEEPFLSMNPTLENITGFLLKGIQKILHPLGWMVFTIEVSETPARSFIISLVENNVISDLQQQNLTNDIIQNSFPKDI